MSIQDRRDGMVAWWENIAPGQWVYVEAPGHSVLAEIRPVAGCLWDARLADGCHSRFRLMRRAVEWCELGVLNNGLLN